MLSLIMKRRSIRKFKDEKLSKEEIKKLIKAGLLAPTSKNKKVVELIAVDDKDIILKLKDCKNMGSIGLNTAPFALAVIADSQKSDVWVEDASIAASYIQLAAEDMGLGTVWIQMRKRFSDYGDAEKEVRKVLNIPEKYGVVCIIAAGYKNENIGPYTDKDVEVSRVHYNKF